MSVPVRPPRREAGGDRRRCFDGLLIKRARMPPQFAEAGSADGAKMPSRSRLLLHQPAKGTQSGIYVIRRLRRHAR